MTSSTALDEETGSLALVPGFPPPQPDSLLPHARALMDAQGTVPSGRTLMRKLKVGSPRAAEIREQLISENPDSPVSSGAPSSGPHAPTYNQARPAGKPGFWARAEHRMQGTALHRSIALIVPLILVNSAAVYGQQGWAFDHLAAGRVIAILFATALESIGIYLAAEAHAALMAGDASARLRMGSYLVGLLVGALNYAHFSSGGYRPNPLALTFGLLSSISPWLWSIRSRSLNRDRLRELNLVDPRAVRFSLLRWALYPIRTFAAFRLAVWDGVVAPADAIANADLVRANRRHARAAEKAGKTKTAPANAVVFVEPANQTA